MSVLPFPTDELRCVRNHLGVLVDVERKFLVSDGSIPYQLPARYGAATSPGPDYVNVNPQPPGDGCWHVPSWQRTREEWRSLPTYFRFDANAC